MRRQRAGVGADDVAHGNGRAADQAVNRGLDVGVIQVDLRLPQLGLGGEELGLAGPLGRDGVVDQRCAGRPAC